MRLTEEKGAWSSRVPRWSRADGRLPVRAPGERSQRPWSPSRAYSSLEVGSYTFYVIEHSVPAIYPLLCRLGSSGCREGLASAVQHSP